MNIIDLQKVGGMSSFSPDCRTHLPGSNLPVDREGFKKFVGMLYKAFPDLHHEIEYQLSGQSRQRSGYAQG